MNAFLHFTYCSINLTPLGTSNFSLHVTINVRAVKPFPAHDVCYNYFCSFIICLYFNCFYVILY